MFETNLNERESRVEWTMIGPVLGLMIIGIAFIYSASTAADPRSHLYLKQGLCYGIGAGLAVGLCLVDYHLIARWSLVGYWTSVLLLSAIFVIGTSKFGARRWIDLGFFQFQPSEIAKLAFIFAQANFLSRPQDELRLPGVFLKAIGLTLIPFLLIL